MEEPLEYDSEDLLSSNKSWSRSSSKSSKKKGSISKSSSRSSSKESSTSKKSKSKLKISGFDQVLDDEWSSETTSKASLK